MTIYYVDSAAGSNTTPYNSWATAGTTLQVAATLAVGGDTIYVASSHAETGAVALTLTFAGSTSSFVKVICTDKTNTPPLSSDLIPASGSTTPGGGGSISTTGASSINFVGFIYIRGITFNVGTSNNTGNFDFAVTAGNTQFFELCQFVLSNTATGSKFTASAVVACLDFLNCTAKFSNASQGMILHQGGTGGMFRWHGGGLDSGTTVPTILFIGSTTKGLLTVCEGVDFSIMGSGKTIFGSPGAVASGRWTLNNCKLGASVTINGAMTTVGNVIDVINCDSGATNYRNERHDFFADLTTDTVDIRSGGSTDGVTPIAWKVVTLSTANLIAPFECLDIMQWFGGSGLGSSHTATIYIMSNATLTNADIWPEIEYLGNAGFPIASIVSGGLADPLASNNGGWANDGVSSWTTTGVSGPVFQKMSVTFTPQLAGYVRCRIKIAKASQTLRIDPLLQVV